ncbi:pseudouridine synthase [Comamonas antarctica]|uniref:pseudouridine synthase n=1 Tax=Comamonas antarctica TaxID=2743470 RepID=UPI0028E4BFEA|nr:pseudouridine synthase [Comamonas antarctica]
MSSSPSSPRTPGSGPRATLRITSKPAAPAPAPRSSGGGGGGRAGKPGGSRDGAARSSAPYGDRQRGPSGAARFERRDGPRRDDPRGGPREEGPRGPREGGGREGSFGRSDGAPRFEGRDGPRRDDRGPRSAGPREGGGFGRPDGAPRFEGRDGPRRDDRGPRQGGPRQGGFGRPDGAPRFEGRDGPRRDERGPRSAGPREGGGFGRPDGGPRFEGRDGPRRDDRRSGGGERARPAGRSFGPGADRGGRDERNSDEAPRRPFTGIRTYQVPTGADARKIPVKRPPQAAQQQDAAPGSVRINKRMADMGLCSRREADDWVEKGWVRVNGQVAEMGVMVLPSDRITVDDAAKGVQEQQVTILMHKPMGYVSGQAEDGHTPAVALINAQSRWNQDGSPTRFNFSQLKGLAPCGRLDIDSVGLLVLTQDGRVARQLIGEDSEIDKEYLVRVTYGDVQVNVQERFPAEQLARLCHGLSLDDQPLKPAKVEWQNPEQLRFVLTEGKKRQIRRMCELVGLKVVGLKRIRIGKVVLGNLPAGQWRYLGADESF